MSNAAEYISLDESGGFVELAGWSIVELAGDDRAAFLHNFCTNEIRKLAIGAGCEAFLLDAKGHVQFYVLVFCLPDRLVLQAGPECGERLMKHLDRYLIREKVTLCDRSASIVQLLVAGREIAGEVERALEVIPPESSLGVVECPSVGAGALVARGIHTVSPNYLLLVPREAAETVKHKLSAAGLSERTAKTWHAARIEAGFPLQGVDVTDKNLAQEIDRIEQTINFRKGCYLGQETVARLDALGHVNKTLVGLRFALSEGSTVDAGVELTIDGQVVGHVTSAAYSARLRTVVALGYVRRGRNTPGTELDSSAGKAEVVALPMR